MTQLRSSVCLVTGATGGIGRATVAALRARGAEIIAAGRDGDALRALAREQRVRVLGTDLEEPSGAQRLVAGALAAHGRVDVLVACAGVGMSGRLASQDDGELERLVRLNLVAAIVLTRGLLPGMIERRRGHVVVIGSVVGRVGRGGETAYAATKGGLAVFADSLREELRGSSVSVSLVSPGVVDTGFFERRGAAYDRGWPRPIPPARVAAAVVRAIEHDRAEVFVPGWLAAPARLRGAAPGLYRALARRFD